MRKNKYIYIYIYIFISIYIYVYSILIIYIYILSNILCITYTIYIIGEKVCMYPEGNILGVSGFRCFMHLQWASLLFAIPPLQLFSMF